MRASFNGSNGLKGGVGNALDTYYSNRSGVPIGKDFMGESGRRPVVGDKAIQDFGVSTANSEQPFDVDPTGPASSSPRSAMMLNMENLSQQPENQAQILQFVMGQLIALFQQVALPGEHNLIPQGDPIEPFDEPAEAPADNAAPDDEGVPPRGLAVCCSILAVTFFAPIILIGALVLGAMFALLKGVECAGKVGASLLSFSSCLCPLALVLGSLVFVCTFAVALPVYSVLLFGYLSYRFIPAIVHNTPYRLGLGEPYPEPVHIYQHIYNRLVAIFPRNLNQ